MLLHHHQYRSSKMPPLLIIHPKIDLATQWKKRLGMHLSIQTQTSISKSQAVSVAQPVTIKPLVPVLILYCPHNRQNPLLSSSVVGPEIPPPVILFPLQLTALLHLPFYRLAVVGSLAEIISMRIWSMTVEVLVVSNIFDSFILGSTI
jgi:hypothetical protein